MIVRGVRWSDFDDLREMYYRLYEERDGGEPTIGITLYKDRPSMADEVAWFAGQYRRVLEGDCVLSVAEVDGRVVGNCVIDRHAPSASSEGGHVGMLGILVDKEFRGKGVGSALLQHAIDAARGKFEIVRLSVFSVNQRAQELYQRFGFTHCGHMPHHVKRGTTYFDEEQMVLVLDGPSGSTANR
jgi:ribosomal protein S18 acetylase RimI-like enzyme